MKWFRWLTAVLAIALIFAPSVLACPMCQEAAGSAQNGQDDAYYQARAFNHAIYLMVAMPYLLLGGLGFLFYRSVKRAKRDDITGPEDP